MSDTIYNFSAKALNGQDISLEDYRGKVLLIVNTASKCGFTPQYEGLQELYNQYHDKGFEVLAFPCNQFGAQEPGDSSEILNFCKTNYDVHFPLFNKIDVNGDDAHPLFNFLKISLPGILGTEKIKWNFTKFLIDKNGKPYKRYAPKDGPQSLSKDIERLLNQ